ncbi:MAG: right-handed parallel beta-helix repeat-containing protein [Acidobacteria bacterium]|nr:right-handed parallel beta-helix repeat-containing protein [Acidobacteriota bacterium]
MRTKLLSVALLTATLCAAPAFAQATRTWVSGVGDDANPCSRTAPCKTFAGAISKTAAGGEIDTLDPGGFGAVTITKSITIDGTFGNGSILASGVSGVIINALSTDTVILRGLSINGAGSTLGTNGINVLAAKSVEVTNCIIQNFSTTGISLNTTGSVNARITDTKIINVTGTGVGVLIGNSGGNKNRVTLNQVQISSGGGDGIKTLVGGRFAVANSLIANNGGAGIHTTGSSVNGVVEKTQIVYNDTGLNAEAGTTIRVSESVVSNSTNAGIYLNGGSIYSFGNNRVAGNGTNDGPFTLPNINQQ